ncbi:MAG: hypothetical protein RLZZ574_2755 [Cyanobacteriota bacterium]
MIKNEAVESYSSLYLCCLRARGSGDRAIDSGSIGRGFESLRAHKIKTAQDKDL